MAASPCESFTQHIRAHTTQYLCNSLSNVLVVENSTKKTLEQKVELDLARLYRFEGANELTARSRSFSEYLRYVLSYNPAPKCYVNLRRLNSFKIGIQRVNPHHLSINIEKPHVQHRDVKPPNMELLDVYV